MCAEWEFIQTEIPDMQKFSLLYVYLCVYIYKKREQKQRQCAGIAHGKRSTEGR